ncbi:MAG: DUF1018 domain-containing protein [Candidatus Omnitrophica bacterium]|nr:DUF1018 domain-containing protein [Candidatus Omnitrophota bacterium]
MDKKKLALIHIVKKELGLSDEEYRTILNAAVGVNSAKELDDEKFRTLMNYFVRSSHYRVNPYGLTIRQKVLIKALVQALAWDENHFSNFLQKYYHKRSIENLTKNEAIKLIESLKNIKEHSAIADKTLP